MKNILKATAKIIGGSVLQQKRASIHTSMSKVFGGVAIILLLLGAGGSVSIAQTPESPAYWPTEGWQTSTPEEQGMNSAQLAEMMDYLQGQNSFTIHSLLIIRNGYVVTDAYFDPYAPDMPHDLQSVTKSFTSSLIGIAIDQGYIESVRQPVLEFFQERTVAHLDANKAAMTLEDLLTMRSGFQCDNPSATPQMQASPDWVQFALDLPMVAEPGTRYNYCNPNSHLLSAIIRETTGMSALAFAQEHLFGPLGISDIIWPPDPQGNNGGFSDMRLTPHDMAKLGYLYLNEGLWDGRQVVSAAWVKTATSALTRHSHADSDYGYLWWVEPSGSYYEAAGNCGQEIYVLPDRDMVVVMTGASGGGGPGAWGERLLKSHIIPLAESAAPLPANPDGVAALESKIQQAAVPPAPPQSEPVPPLPETAERVSGQTFAIDPNPAGLLSVSLTFQETEVLIRQTISIGPDETLDVEWPVGLDNVYRFIPGEYGVPTGFKGWWESDNVFVFLQDRIGYYMLERIRVTFEGDQVTIAVEVSECGGPFRATATLVGWLAE